MNVSSDQLAIAANQLCAGNSPFDQILYDPTLKVLGFRYAGGWRYLNIWLDSDLATTGDHCWETNNTPSAHSEVLYDYYEEVKP